MAAHFDSVTLDDLHRRRSEKWSKHPADVLPSFIAETDFEPPPAVARVLTEAVAAGDLGYANAAGSGVAEAFGGFASRRWCWEVDPGSVVALPEIMVGVAELLRVLTEPGDGVVIATPAYPPFFSVIAEVGRRAVEVPLEPGARRLPIDGFRAAFEAGARTLLLCNPHNPTGYAAHRDELEAVAALADEYGVLVLADEIHAPLVLDGVHIPFCPLYESAIALTSASKGWNVPGLKCALAVAGSDRMRQALARLPYDMPDRVGHLGVLATEAAFAEGGDWLDELLAHLLAVRDRLSELVAEQLPGVVYEPGSATYLAWLDCRELGLGGDPSAHFLERGRIALAPGHRFGDPGRGFARLNFGTSRAIVEEMVARMARAVS